jgi:hypothetical protein
VAKVLISPVTAAIACDPSPRWPVGLIGVQIP